MGTPQKLRCRVANVIDHGERVYTLDLVPERPPAPRFKAGQFLHLALDKYDPSDFWPESRVFSIASSSRERDSLRITYSVRGRYTARMEKEIVSGREVFIKMPYGEFSVNMHRQTVLIAGGTGITAFTSFLSDIQDQFKLPLTIIYGARERRLLIYRRLIEQCVQRVASISAIYFLENADMLEENELSGQISVTAARGYIPEIQDSDYYLSGPPLMLQTLATQLHNMGVAATAIFTDAWE